MAIFGLSKASFNLIAAHWAASYSRTHILALGWLISLISPLLILRATAWSDVLWSTLFFGAAQGILTSTSVIMLMDRVSNRQRGVLNGVLECTIYVSLAAFTLLSGWIEEVHGYRPVICYVSAVVSIAGLLSTACITDTRALVKAEEQKMAAAAEADDTTNPLITPTPSSSPPRSPTSHPVDIPQPDNPSPPTTTLPPDSSDLSTLSALSRCFHRPHLLALIFAGFCNNFDDGVIWGSLPAFFAQQDMPTHLITVLLTVYPLVWGLLQVATGMMADRHGRKAMIVAGMCCQSSSFLLMFLTSYHHRQLEPATGISATSLPFLSNLLACVVLGIGTALCYPVLQASLSDSVPPKQRASTLGVYRLCRDSGYVGGGLLSGVVADWLDLNTVVLGLSGLLMCAAVYGQLRLTPDRNPK